MSVPRNDDMKSIKEWLQTSFQLTETDIQDYVKKSVNYDEKKNN